MIRLFLCLEGRIANVRYTRKIATPLRPANLAYFGAAKVTVKLLRTFPLLNLRLEHKTD